MATFFNKQVILINNDDDLCALADARTEERISDWFVDIEEFDKQFVKVTKYDEEDNECYALVNQQGKVVTDWFVDIDKFDNQFYKATKYDAEDNETYALINQQGNLISDWFSEIDDFKDGFAKVTNYNDEGDEIYALIDKSGKLISKWYDDDSNFDDLREAKQSIASENTENVKEQQEAMSAPSVQSKEIEKTPAVSQNANPNNTHYMYNEQLENLIDAALADGVLTEKEKQILFKKAQAMGVDLDEFEMVLDARLIKLQKAEQEKATSSAPKSNKLGDVKKCPSCGAMVQSFQGVCPECGYAFEGVDANSAIKELSNLLQRESDIEKMERIIDSFPIPMDKATLLAFLTWLRPQSVDTKNPLANSYFKKYAECVNKIRVSFSTDNELQQFVSFFETDEQKVRKQKLLNNTLSLLKNKWFYVGLAVCFILFLIFKPTPIHKSIEKSSAAIEQALKDGDTHKATEIYLTFQGDEVYEFRQNETERIMDACLETDNFKDALRIGNKYGLAFGSEWSHNIKEASLAQKLYNYCINHNDFENARIIVKSADYSDEKKFIGMYIKDVVVRLCEQGKKDDARTFLNNNKDEIDSEYDKLGKSNEVVKKIQNIINSY